MDIARITGGLPAAGGLEALETARLGAAAGAARSGGADAAKKLEELFATMLVKEMRRALPEGLFGEGSTADIYGGWFDEHIGAQLARTGALGMGEMIRASLLAKSEAAAAAADAPEKE
jgi:Rod binding domain-containing protein